jgi:hypothetical protein
MDGGSEQAKMTARLDLGDKYSYLYLIDQQSGEVMCGHEVLVANARKLRLIYANKQKTDEIDAENLARLAGVDPKLLYPLKHRGEDSRAHMAIIRGRTFAGWSCAAGGPRQSQGLARSLKTGYAKSRRLVH